MYSFEVRKKRLEKRIAQVFSEFLLYEVADDRLRGHFVSVIRVKLSQDLARVTIFFRLLNPKFKNKIIKLLYHIQPFFSIHLRKKISMRKMPEIRFVFDEKYDTSNEVLYMIEEIRKTMGPKKNNILK